MTLRSLTSLLLISLVGTGCGESDSGARPANSTAGGAVTSAGSPNAAGTAGGGAGGAVTGGSGSGLAGSVATGGMAAGGTGGAATGGAANGGAANGGAATSGAANGGAGGGVTCPAGGFAWPKGAVAAVSLTYDDSLKSQLDYAVPVLDANGLTATFFLSGNIAANAAKYSALIPKGYELASHTIKHPCDPDLAGYTAASMGTELDAGIAGVQALGPKAKLTFAYPCGQTNYGTPAASYIPLVKERFSAARGTTWAVADPKTVDLFNVPSAFPPTTSDGSDFITLIKSAETSGGWAVLGVHGVSAAGEYLQLPQPAHDAIVKYLKDNAARIWTAPFGAVAAHVAACR